MEAADILIALAVAAASRIEKEADLSFGALHEKSAICALVAAEPAFPEVA